MTLIFLIAFVVVVTGVLQYSNIRQGRRAKARARRHLGIYSQKNQMPVTRTDGWKTRFGTMVREFIHPLPLVTALVATYFVSAATHPLLGLILGAVTFWLSHKFVLMREARKRLDKIERELPQAIDVLARSVSAGVPMQRAILSVRDAFDSPLGQEFERLYDALILGVPFQQALTDASRRVNSSSFQYFTAILSLNAETGGPLVEVLNNLSSGLRERQKLEKKLLALTAEPRMAARVVTGIPVALLTLQFIRQPEQLDFLLKDSTGQWVTLYAVLSIALGLFIIQRLTKLE